MPDAPADAITVGSWLRRSGQLVARAQRLLVFPVSVAAIALLITLPAAFAAGAGDSFTDLAKYAVQVDEQLLDGLADEVSVDALEYALIGLVLIVRPLSQAWLTGCFLRSLVLGRVVRFPGWPVFARLALFYTALVPLTLGLAALARVEGPAAFLALAGVVVLAVPTITADYAVGIDELGVVQAIRASIASVRRAPGVALFAFWFVYASGVLVSLLFDEQIADADEVFPLFLVATALASGVRAYLADCALISFYLGNRDI